MNADQQVQQRTSWRQRVSLILVVLVVGGATILTIQSLHQSNLEYLASSARNSQVLFASLSVLKGILAVVEGSGFIFEVGDAIQPVYDMVDFAWRLSLVSAIVLTTLKSMLPALMKIGTIVLIATVVTVVISRFVFWTFFPKKSADDQSINVWFRNGILWVIKTLASMTLLLYVAIPLAVALGHHISDTLREGPETHVSVDSVTEDLHGIKGPRAIIRFVRGISDNLIEYIIRKMSSVLFDLAIFPIAVLVIFFFGLRRLGVGIGRPQRFMAWLFRPRIVRPRMAGRT